MPGVLLRGIYDLKSRAVHRRVRATDAALLQDEYLPQEVLLSRQRASALAIARYAYERTSFYRQLYSDAGLTPADLHDAAVLEELPIVEKQDLRDHFSAFRAVDVAERRVAASHTGGSTGEPLRLLHDRDAPVASMWHRVYRWWGVHPADHQALVSRNVRVGAGGLARTVGWWPTRQIQLDARAMDRAAVVRFVRQWRHVRPRLLNGYVGGVHELAQHLEEHEIALPTPVAVGVTAAPITPSQRAQIATVFRAPVRDQYRSAEIPWIAAECSSSEGLHVLADLRRLEVVDEQDHPCPPGVVGSVVLTDLTNGVFPLVRYRLGDRTALLDRACSCGRSLPLIAPVEGRVSDVLRTPEGRSVTGGLTALFNDAPETVTQFQVHQHRDFSVTLRYVPAKTHRGGPGRSTPDGVEGALRTLRTVLGPTVRVSAEPVDRIPHLGGKARVVVSDLVPPTADASTEAPAASTRKASP